MAVNNRIRNPSRTPRILNRKERPALAVHALHAVLYPGIRGRQKVDTHANGEDHPLSYRVRSRQRCRRQPERVYRCSRRPRAREEKVVFVVEHCASAFATNSLPCHVHLLCWCCCHRQCEAATPTGLGPAPSRSPFTQPGHCIASPPGESRGHRRSLTRARRSLRVRLVTRIYRCALCRQPLRRPQFRLKNRPKAPRCPERLVGFSWREW